MFKLYQVSLYLLLSFISINCQAENAAIKIEDNWARATAPGQEVGAAYLTLTSTIHTTLTSVESPAADSVEIHSMTMDNGVMKMRSMKELLLSPNTPVKLEPGSFHLMLFDLKKPLQAGDKVQFKLHFKDPSGKTSVVEITSPIKKPND